MLAPSEGVAKDNLTKVPVRVDGRLLSEERNAGEKHHGDGKSYDGNSRSVHFVTAKR